MAHELKVILLRQLEAAMCTLRQCIDSCPMSEWDEAHDDAPFSQVLFHTLFYTDFYLEEGEEAFKAQSYHASRADMFRDYEELENRPAVWLYTKSEVMDYFSFCLEKIRLRLAADDEVSLLADSRLGSRVLPRAEKYMILTRHIQHHAAQLGLVLQKPTGKNLAWISSGWKNL